MGPLTRWIAFRIVATWSRRIKVIRPREGRSAPRAALGAALALLAASAVVAPVSAQAPDQRWRSLSTDHFYVTFPEHLESLARRAASRAEEAYTELADHFVDPPRGRIDLVLTDHTDVTNGFARVTPSNRITIYARPPVDDLALGYFDEWLDLVITHELAHVFHLDRTGFLGKVTRGVFGRVPSEWPAFPGHATPTWTKEGLATWYESYLTEAGRGEGSYHEMVVRTAALEDRFEEFDQVSGDSPVWPGGSRAYIYGSLFFEHLLDKHGEEKMGAFADAVAGQWIPYRLDAAGRSAFGTSLSDEWAQWTQLVGERAGAVVSSLERRGGATPTERLTQGARYGLHPKVSPDGGRLAYVRSDGRSDSQLWVGPLDASPTGAAVRTNGLPTFDWSPDGGIVLAQLELKGPYRSFRDLYRVDPEGATVRLTEGMRLNHPSVDPDGERAVAVQETDGTNALVSVDLRDGSVVQLVGADPDVHWSFPSVSPDGSWIAVSRWRLGGYQDVVILDRQGTQVGHLTDDRALDLAPAWSPDGRYVVWMSDRTGIPNVMGVEVSAGAPVGEPRMVTDVATGASYPSVSPDGRWVYVSGYHADGWEVERLPFEPDAWRVPPPMDQRFRGPARAPAGAVTGDVRGYSAFRSLLPRYWEPLYQEPLRTREIDSEEFRLASREILGASFGAETSGSDVTGRHSYDAFLRVFESMDEVDGGLSYTFRGLGNPSLSIAASQGWGHDGPRFGRQQVGAPLDTLFVKRRSRSLSGAVGFSRPQWRNFVSLTLSGGVSWEHRILLDYDLRPSQDYRLIRPDSKVADMRATLSFGTTRSHAFQVGAANGFSASIRGRIRDPLSLPDSLAGDPIEDSSVQDVVATLRAFRTLGGPGFAAHVLAFRWSGGAARGASADASHFGAGGASGRQENISGLELFGGNPLLFPIRGYERLSRTGRYAWSGSVEYRFPLWLVNQGLGAWPLHVDRVVGSIFFDAGNAWGGTFGLSDAVNDRRATLTSLGAEVTVGFLTFWDEPLWVRTGLAQPLSQGGSTTAYVRVGLAF